MPTHGNSLGLDTVHQLRRLPTWQAVRNWRAPTPVVFACRYFLQTPPGAAHVWVNGETDGVRHSPANHPQVPPLNPDLHYVAPIQGPGPTPHQNPRGWRRAQGQNPQDGTPADKDTVRRWGAEDANAICNRIWAVVKRGDLQFPSPKKVIVYLDIEPRERLSPDYWYGWASKVWWFSTGLLEFPFYPGLYCATMHQAGAAGDPYHNRIPSGDVQGALNDPVNTLASRCYGIWAASPLTNASGFNPVPAPDHARFRPGFQPDWDTRFAAWQQTVHIIFGLFEWKTAVPVRMWQYVTEEDKNNPNVNQQIATFNALDVDLDETSPLAPDAPASADALNWMLVIP